MRTIAITRKLQRIWVLQIGRASCRERVCQLVTGVQTCALPIYNKNDHKYDIEQRRLRSPDAYDCYYKEIAKDLGITDRAVSKATEVLKELGLIYAEALPRIHLDGQWITDHTIFCNMYKREGSKLLATGEDYYLGEAENKKKKLKQLRGRK